MRVETYVADASVAVGTGAGVPLPLNPISNLHRLGEMVGKSLVMQRLFMRLRLSAAHLRVMTLEGEAGTGKTLAARTLHGLGPGLNGGFVVCTAAHFAGNLAGGEAKSALDDASGGTLLLTRLHELQADQQMRLFDFLEWWEHRAGRQGNVLLPRQIFVSSQVSLRQLTANGSLRADLCYRLTAIRFVLPPLRERREDIAILADWFAARHGVVHGKMVRGLGPGALARLMSHTWPGNVRELESAIANAVLECEGQWIRPIDIPALLPLASPSESASAVERAEDDPNLDRMIVRHIRHVLEKAGGNKLRAAQLLGISRSTLYRLLDGKDAKAEKAAGPDLSREDSSGRVEEG